MGSKRCLREPMACAVGCILSLLRSWGRAIHGAPREGSFHDECHRGVKTNHVEYEPKCIRIDHIANRHRTSQWRRPKHSGIYYVYVPFLAPLRGLVLPCTSSPRLAPWAALFRSFGACLVRHWVPAFRPVCILGSSSCRAHFPNWVTGWLFVTSVTDSGSDRSHNRS